MYERKGLIYSVLNENRNKIGVPIKASDFYNKPTLKNLEKKFRENEKQKQVSGFIHLQTGFSIL